LAGTKDAIGVWGHEYVRYFFFFVAIWKTRKIE
jgi:hypothetical protein